MTHRDPEEALRQRFERALAGMPGPEPARLQGIRRRLRRRRSHGAGLWLAAALVIGTGAAASAYWLPERTAPDAEAPAAEEEQPALDGADAEPADDEARDRAAEPATQPQQPGRSRDGDAVIYRQAE